MDNYYIENINFITENNFFEFEVNFWDLSRNIILLKELLIDKKEDIIKEFEEELSEDIRAFEICNLYFSGKETKIEFDKYVSDANNYLYKLIDFSKIHNLYFNFCLFEVYEKTLNERLQEYLIDEYEVNEIDFFKNEYEKILIDYETFELSNVFSKRLVEILNKTKEKKISLLDEKLNNLGIKTLKITDNIHHYFDLKTKIEFVNISNLENKIESKSTSLIYNGKPLNLYERFTIANKFLDLGNKIHKLNISQAKKNELLSYILGCNIDNAKKILNGTYPNKKRDLTDLFNDLDLNK